MKENMTFSIIVPVYNVEKYVARCIDSLLAQTFKSYEIIIVNDGSTDCSAEIIKRYLNAENSIRYIEISNEGVSNARNIGIREAKGEYVFFVDADDFIEIDALETIANNIEEDCDILMFNYKLNGVVHNINQKQIKGNKQETAIWNLSGLNAYCGFVWNKVFRTKLLMDNNIAFRSDIHMCEDLLFCLDCVKNTDRISYISDALYNYIDRAGSASGNTFSEKKLSVLQAYDNLLKRDIILGNKQIYQRYSNQYVHHCLRLYWMARQSNEKEICREMKNKVKKENFSFVYDDIFGLKYKILFLFVRLF